MAKYEYVDSQKNDPLNTNPVVKMCSWLGVSTSGFHHWLSRPQSATAARREALTAWVGHFFDASDGTYGYRRIHADLTDDGTECSPELVGQIMRDECLVAWQPRPFRVTTDADAEAAAGMPLTDRGGDVPRRIPKGNPFVAEPGQQRLPESRVRGMKPGLEDVSFGPRPVSEAASASVVAARASSKWSRGATITSQRTVLRRPIASQQERGSVE